MPGHQLAPDIPSDVLAAEQAHLAESRQALQAMREHAQSLSADAAGDWVSQQILQSLLDQRVAALADHPDTPLFFGRLDRAAVDDLPGTIYVGRRHVHDGGSRPLVIDWRAPVSRAFYQASPTDPMDVVRRRRFGYHGGALTAFEDESLADGAELGPASGASKILTEEIERPRTGPMRDIVATIQPDQDEIVRAALAQTVCVQGAPGTGKTAVGLHRAAYLLFTHRERLARAGVMIVGPNKAFLSYISSVLPALGEVKVDQTTAMELLGGHAAPEDPEVAAIKGSARMAAVLERALWLHIVKPAEGVVYTKGVYRFRVADHEVREIVASLRGTTRYGPGRAALAQRLAHQVLVRMEQRGESPDDRVQDAVARSKPVKELVDAVWPKLVPAQVLYRLLSDPDFLAQACAKTEISASEQEMLLWPQRSSGASSTRPYRSWKSAKWSAADAALLDELADLIERTPSIGHLVVDEAQDLSEMQLRALGRRCRTGSATVLGDLAQGTTPWSTSSWESVLEHLGQTTGEVTELTLGFRVPREVLDFAARLLPAIAPELAPPRSLRPGAGSLTVRPSGTITDTVREVLAREGSIGVIAPDDLVPSISSDLSGVPHAVLGPESTEEHRVLVIPATLAKGLEYDHVIVLEPADIVSAEPRGLARLYVVLTRAVTSLTVLHSKPLPALLAG
ncbi:HelD family protein [Nonomuraea sp. NPDC050536]|uniref:HelD family protein n=1 Tax=Nonomuraea sp. NPDC050536 TaxID=3364366 RepID=UPI0037C8C201